MIEPTKHERLRQNLLVIGSDIIRYIKNNPVNIQELYQQFNNEYQESNHDKFYDAITFLWLLNFIQIEDNLISLVRSNNVSQKALF